MANYFASLVPLLLAGLIPNLAEGHGSMVKPFSWVDTGGNVGMASFRSCQAGSNLPQLGGNGAACLWFTNNTLIPGERTIDIAMSTFPQVYDTGLVSVTPWAAPGSAPIFSPCGVGGGNPNGCPDGSSQDIGDFCPGGGWSYGPLAEQFYIEPGFPDVVTTEWKIGSTVEAAWATVANHGGGYSYRICKVPEEGMAGLTEECFQQTPLDFSGDVQWVQYGDDVDNRIEFKALRTREGTFPEGSHWTRDPIPNCLYDFEDPLFGIYDINCTNGTQYPPPAPGLLGYGQKPAPTYEPTFAFSIVDHLVVPDHLTPGDYVLSFRWDCEQTTQVWNQCANIKIVE